MFLSKTFIAQTDFYMCQLTRQLNWTELVGLSHQNSPHTALNINSLHGLNNWTSRIGEKNDTNRRFNYVNHFRL